MTLVEVLPHILRLAFDEELALEAEEILNSRGVKILTGVGVKEIIGDKKVTGILLNSGEKLETDAVVLSMGYNPNTALAEKSGIKLNEKGFIKRSTAGFYQIFKFIKIGIHMLCAIVRSIHTNNHRCWITSCFINSCFRHYCSYLAFPACLLALIAIFIKEFV